MFRHSGKRGLFPLTAVVCLLFAAPSAHADVSRALAAYKSGDYAVALDEFRASAEAGDATAMFSLGYMYLRGEGVQADQKQAVVWLTRAAEQGIAPAQHSLALAFYEGRGVERNTAVAANYFESAALQGLADAQYNLGVLCARGEGVKQDWALAQFWYGKAAEQGVTDAMVALGVMAANGQGMDRDYAKSAQWFGQAAAAGNKRARRMLEVAFADPIPDAAVEEPSELRGTETLRQPDSQANAGAPPMASGEKSAAPAPHTVAQAVPTAPVAQRGKRFWRTAPPKLEEQDFQALQAKALTGSAAGQVDLALQYYHGASVRRSLIRAYVWAKLAALKGDVDGENMSSAIHWELDDHQKSVADQVLRQWTQK